MALPNSLPSRTTGVQNEAIEYPDEIRAGDAVKLPGPIAYDAALTVEVRVGELLARHSSTGRYWPRKSTELAATEADSQTVLSVDDAHPFEIGDVVTVGDRTGTYTITAKDEDSSPNTITVSSGLTGGTNPSPVNARVYVASNGLGNAVGIAAERFTPNTQKPAVGQGSMYIAGLFYKGKLKGSAAGVDTQAQSDLGGTTITRTGDPDGDLYRIA